METVIIIIIIYIFITIFDFIPVLKRKHKNEIWVYGVSLVASFVVLFLNSLGVSIPFDIY